MANTDNSKEFKEIGLQPARGFKDLLPLQTLLRDRIISTILETYRSYGFDRIEAPAVEDIRRLRHSEGGENLTMVFEILKRGDELDRTLNTTETAKLKGQLSDLGLRYDLTVPLARYYAYNRAQLPNPFKSIHIGPVWRAERPQHGRYRQFMQCDIDVIGVAAPFAEAELIIVTVDALNKIGLKKAQVLVNDRQLLCALILASGVAPPDLPRVLIILDKLDKIGLEGVEQQLKEQLGTSQAISKLLTSLVKISKATPADRLLVAWEECKAHALPEKVFRDLQEVLKLQDILEKSGNSINFEPFLIRGMGYYTGQIFEIRIDDFTGGSIAGGGRYDNLIGKFSGNDVPACGFSIGFERIISVLEEKEKNIACESDRLALFYDIKNCNIVTVMDALKNLKTENSSVSMLPLPKNLKHALEQLKRSGFKSFAIFRPGETVVSKIIE